jgi:hypothetical protein
MASNRWEILPFFYSLGAWPKVYRERPVFYALPYEKGPPSHFVGHIRARWDAPGAIVDFEGPKTPLGRTSRETIRQCLVGSEKSWSCLKIRELTLQRHLEEIQKKLAGTAGGNTALRMKWKLRWFTVRNPALAPAEQAQGIYLSAQDGDQGEERYVLITQDGTHQAISLNLKTSVTEGIEGAEAKLAKTTFEQAIRSIRASDELTPGRTWINRQLETIQLQKGAEQELSRLAAAQASLISKISVEPKVYEAYFHLGGTALLLQQLARKSGGALAMELSSVAKPLLQNTSRYVQDLNPKDPRTQILQGYWLESQKL